MSRFPWYGFGFLWGCFWALGLGGGLRRVRGSGEGKGVLEIPPLPLGSCVMLESSLVVSEPQCLKFVTKQK